MAARRPPVLLGRARERQAFDRLLENVRRGQSAVLVVRGEAGVGKTALLQHCAAPGGRLPRRADRRRRGRDGAAVRRPAPAVRADARPARRAPGAAARRAVRRAGPELRRRSRSASSSALAVLSLLSAVAEERPLLCLVDDAQWLDGASGKVLGFVARRLLAESVAIVFAVREPDSRHELDGLPELRARGAWTRRTRGRCWRGRSRAGSTSRVRDRIVAETRGNPLALLELPRGMSRDGAGRRLRAPAHGRPARAVSRSTSCGASARCPSDAAADAAGGGGPGRRRHALWRAADGLGIGIERARAGEGGRAAGRSARASVPPPAGALGGLPLGAAGGPPGGARGAGGGQRPRRGCRPARVAPRAGGGRPRRGRGRGARALGRARADARRARGGGGVPASGPPRSRADPGAARRRALAAAQAKHQAGRPEAALALLASAQAGPLDPLQRAQVELLRARDRVHVEPRQRRSRAAAERRPAARAARRAARARDLPGRLMAAQFAGRLRRRRRARGRRRPPATAPAAPSPRAPDLLLDGLATCSSTGTAPPRRS